MNNQKMKITYSDGSTKIEDKVMKIEPYVEEPTKIYANWNTTLQKYSFDTLPLTAGNKGGFTEKEALISRLYMVINEFKVTPEYFEKDHRGLIKELAKRL